MEGLGGKFAGENEPYSRSGHDQSKRQGQTRGQQGFGFRIAFEEGDEGHLARAQARRRHGNC